MKASELIKALEDGHILSYKEGTVKWYYEDIKPYAEIMGIEPYNLFGILSNPEKWEIERRPNNESI